MKKSLEWFLAASDNLYIHFTLPETILLSRARALLFLFAFLTRKL